MKRASMACAYEGGSMAAALQNKNSSFGRWYSKLLCRSSMLASFLFYVIPAKAGIQRLWSSIFEDV